MEGVKFMAVVHQEKEKLSPLVQGGLEIIIKMKVTWESQEKLTILSVKVAEIAYRVDADYNYKDDSKEILKVLQVEEEDVDDEKEAEENFDVYDDVASLNRKYIQVNK